MEGTPFGRYRLVELLGRGGMGEVWRAYDTVTDRGVAIKVLAANLSEDEDFQRRFRREAHAAARLDTPHVVPIYDYGEIDGRLFVSMRIIQGRDLDTVLNDGPLEPARAVRIIGQVATALYAAHEVGLVHRDIKPSNILLDRNDFTYLIDFGIAHAADETRLTKAGNTIGTFAYIAPERLDSQAEVDARADTYSLACVLYEALTGHQPFAGTTTAHLIAAHLHSPPPRPSEIQSGVPAQVDAVIAKGMAKQPDQRYLTTVELADAARNAIAVPIPQVIQNQAAGPPAALAPPTDSTIIDARMLPGSQASISAGYGYPRPRASHPPYADHPPQVGQQPAFGRQLPAQWPPQPREPSRPPQQLPSAGETVSPVRRFSRRARTAMVVAAVGIAALITGVVILMMPITTDAGISCGNGSALNLTAVRNAESSLHVSGLETKCQSSQSVRRVWSKVLLGAGALTLACSLFVGGRRP